MAAVYTGERTLLDPVFGGLERLLYRVMRVDPSKGQDWKAYAKSLIIFSLAGWLLLYFILRTQTLWNWTGLNPQHFHSGTWNRDVQHDVVVRDEHELAVLRRRDDDELLQPDGWAHRPELPLGGGRDRGRGRADPRDRVALGQEPRQLLAGPRPHGPVRAAADLVRGRAGARLPGVDPELLALPDLAQADSGGTQTIAQGPVASQEAIKELGTNGGGFFNVNSAHPFENPTGFTNLVEMLVVLIIPAALVFTYGRMAGKRRQGYAIYATMMVMFLGACVVAYIAEAHGSPAQHAAGLHTGVIHGSAGGNMEGKEQRFGIAGSALFDVVTTVTSCGAVNSAIESFTGIGGAIPMANLSASEVIFGGVGTGLYSMLLYVILAVFIGGLMVGRTPEYLGKKIEAREIKLIVLGLLITPLSALFCTALAVASKAGRASIFSPGKPAGVLRELLRLPVAGQQQRLGVRRLHRLHPAQRRQPRRARRHVRRPARRLRRCCSRASRRSCSRSPSPARSPASGSARPASARCAPTTRRSWCC